MHSQIPTETKRSHRSVAHGLNLRGAPQRSQAQRKRLRKVLPIQHHFSHCWTKSLSLCRFLHGSARLRIGTPPRLCNVWRGLTEVLVGSFSWEMQLLENPFILAAP